LNTNSRKSGQLLDQSNHNVHFQENIAQLICLPVILRKGRNYRRLAIHIYVLFKLAAGILNLS